MSLFLECVLWVNITYAWWTVFMIFRMQYLTKHIVLLMRRDFETYERLPEYQFMVKRFWIWDIKKFLK